MHQENHSKSEAWAKREKYRKLKTKNGTALQIKMQNGAQGGRLFVALMGKLTVIKRVVKSFLRQKRFVCTLLDDLAVAHHQNKVAFLDGGKAMRHHERSAPLHQLGKRALNSVLGAGVNGGGRLVQD